MISYIWKVASFNLLKETEPAFKIVYSFNAYSDSRLHFVCVQKSESEASSLGTDKSISDIERLLSGINIFYCDNRGVWIEHFIWLLVNSRNMYCSECLDTAKSSQQE